MALPGVISLGGGAATLLFKRLPDQLFRPLASANRHIYWALLCALHNKRFGQDAPMAPINGFAMREITRDIEEELQQQDAWEVEADEAPDTPIGVRAIGVFNRLRDSGWLRIERVGVEKRVDMHRDVRSFLGRLVEFAETEPVIVGAKISSIDLNLEAVVTGDGSRDAQLHEAADQARHLLDHVRNTGASIRDLMESFGAELTTGQFVQRFFSDYVERVFIGDYRELRTREHPLARRSQILRKVEEAQSNLPMRERLVGWYEAKRAPGDRGRAERLFERDIARLMDLQRIDEYLERLDDEIRRANKRALAFLDYRLRAIRPIDHLVTAAIRAVSAEVDAVNTAPFAPGELAAPEGLAEPRRKVEWAPADALRNVTPSPYEIARAQLMRRARDARSINPLKLAAFVLNQLDGRESMRSDELRLETIEDVRALQALYSVAMATASGSRMLMAQTLMLTRGFRVVPDLEAPAIEARLLSGRPFRLTRIATPSQHRKATA